MVTFDENISCWYGYNHIYQGGQHKTVYTKCKWRYFVYSQWLKSIWTAANSTRFLFILKRCESNCILIVFDDTCTWVNRKFKHRNYNDDDQTTQLHQYCIDSSTWIHDGFFPPYLQSAQHHWTTMAHRAFIGRKWHAGFSRLGQQSLHLTP